MAFTFNPFTGNFDVKGSGGSGTADGFLPYYYVDTGVSVEIPEYRQMNIHGPLTVFGTLSVLGELNLIPDPPREFTGPSFSYNMDGTLSQTTYDDGSYKTFTYSGGLLSETIFYINDGPTIQKVFNYTGSVLDSIDETYL